jgi:NAD+ kinase
VWRRRIFISMIAGIIANPRKPGAADVIRRLRDALDAQGCGTRLSPTTAAMLGEDEATDPADFAATTDLVVVLGGDGTMLHAIARIGDYSKPVAGINIGTLGFLTTCTDEEIPAFAEVLTAGKFTTSPRTLLVATIHRAGRPAESFTALNEVTVARGETGRLVALRVAVDGDHLNDYRADGLLIATPTGSTAYSLSAGGPLITPSAGVFLITPICPHSLSQRSLVVGDDVTIRITPEPISGDAAPLLFNVDGRDNTQVSPGDVIEVRKSPRVLHLLRFADHSFYEALRRKLHWQGLT